MSDVRCQMLDVKCQTSDCGGLGGPSQGSKAMSFRIVQPPKGRNWGIVRIGLGYSESFEEEKTSSNPYSSQALIASRIIHHISLSISYKPIIQMQFRNLHHYKPTGLWYLGFIIPNTVYCNYIILKVKILQLLVTCLPCIEIKYIQFFYIDHFCYLKTNKFQSCYSRHKVFSQSIIIYIRVKSNLNFFMWFPKSSILQVEIF